MQLENNGPAHTTSSFEGQPPTALGALLDRITNDPHRRTASGVAFSPEALGLASWYRANERAAFDAFNEALIPCMGSAVFRWRNLMANAAPIAPRNGALDAAPEQLPETEPANDLAEPDAPRDDAPRPYTSARLDDPDDVSQEAMARHGGRATRRSRGTSPARRARSQRTIGREGAARGMGGACVAGA
nr:hypothetical protein [Deltaproteobacteria bacterium]